MEEIVVVGLPPLLVAAMLAAVFVARKSGIVKRVGISLVVGLVGFVLFIVMLLELNGGQ